MDTYPGGVFKGWKTTVDYALGRPLNIEALVGSAVGKMFEGVEYFGKITAYKKWWKVRYDDGDREQLNYRQLATLSTPPNFSRLKYPAPDQQVTQFLKESDGLEVVEIKLLQEDWALVSVFLVQDSKTPLQGAYVLADDFCHGMRELGLPELLHKHPGLDCEIYVSCCCVA